MKGEKLVFVIHVWFLFMYGSCLCNFVVEKNSLKVIAPENLRDTYECAIGDFGVPRYGGTLSGLVVYPTFNQLACNNFTDHIPLISKKPGSLPVFLLADRGDCYLTLKAWNAQNAGASAILVADNWPTDLITMDFPKDEEGEEPPYVQNITIPSLLISNSLGVSIKEALENNGLVFVNLERSEALPYADEMVEYEFWTNSNDECGPKCDTHKYFVKSFKGVAQILERKGYTRFTPHYITWFCPEEYVSSTRCKSQCINHGRYCAPDPEQDFSKGYEGKDVVVQNLRHACFYKVVNESGKPWVWWDFVTDFATNCSMKEHKFTKDCADEVIKSLGVDLKKIDECMGDPEADAENAVLKAEQQVQIEKGIRGDVMILPTLVINNREYRGKLDKKAVLKAICSGFEETTEPPICLIYGKHVAGSAEWGFAWTVVLGVAAIGIVGYTFYKYRVRRYMDSEIRAIMAQYMPLGNEGEVPVRGSHGEI
ncbi:hypothetical protein Lser_V15G25931 [Lactuca serriola]